jgi:hypothetical protein
VALGQGIILGIRAFGLHTFDGFWERLRVAPAAGSDTCLSPFELSIFWPDLSSTSCAE